MANINRQILLVSRPQGMPAPDNFKLIETELPQINEGEVLIKTLYLSVDPYMRGRMSDAKSYIAPFELDKVLQGGAVGQIIESNHSNYSVGDIVVGLLGWQDYSVSNGKGLAKINPDLAPVTTALSILGMPGLTAYFGLLDIGDPQPGETVVVSGAAGAVGSVAGQIAKIKGCRVVGIAGQDDKISYLINELGFDAAINYNTVPNLKQALKDACPDGVDVYFDNVGGTITDEVMKLINYQAQIVVCGQIASYNLDKPDIGPRVFTQLIKKSALAKGFVQSDYSSRTKEGLTQLAQWFKEGKLSYRENVVTGLENAPQAFLGLFKGENIGKQLVKVAEPETK